MISSQSRDKKGRQDVFSFLFMIAGCLIMWTFNWANLHKFFPLLFEFMSFHVHCLWEINSNFFSLLGWGKTFHDIIFQDQQHIFSLNSWAKTTDIRVSQKLSNPQAKFTWCFVFSTNTLVLFLFLSSSCRIHRLVQCKRFLPVDLASRER